MYESEGKMSIQSLQGVTVSSMSSEEKKKFREMCMIH